MVPDVVPDVVGCNGKRMIADRHRQRGTIRVADDEYEDVLVPPMRPLNTKVNGVFVSGCLLLKAHRANAWVVVLNAHQAC